MNNMLFHHVGELGEQGKKTNDFKTLHSADVTNICMMDVLIHFTPMCLMTLLLTVLPDIADQNPDIECQFHQS
jgi:hypothetical protein